ncbi:hypothetical protein FSP39_022920 [Pinctada imbricata]|uniref:Transglutaminase-like domain-containing protein n=1 Tax=Pinctada imbricata TaxID=66713 RepID=A0AA89BIC4_PINIB|nr:hypothetical protein FSP39_022920 [Pinctada imbricata]
MSPTKTLHYFNAPPGLTKEEIEEMFEKCGTEKPTKIKQFNTKNERSSTGLLQFDSKGDAMEALISVNHYSLPNPNVKHLTSPPCMLISCKVILVCSYDMGALTGRNRRGIHSVSANSVLQLRTCVCEGYANLFEELCKHADIKVKKISGYSKGYGHKPGSQFSYSQQTDHAWNAVYINGRWQFIECTWGSGATDNRGIYHQRFEDFFFFTDPRHFITAHFPYMEGDAEGSKQWQLLEKPVALEEFSNNIAPDILAMKLGLRFSHNDTVINVDKTVEIEIVDPNKRLCVVSSNLFHISGQNYSDFTYTRRVKPGIFQTEVRIPLQGKFELQIYGSTETDSKSLDHVITYMLTSRELNSNVEPYPTIFPDSQRYFCELIEPTKGVLPANTNVKIKIRSPNMVQGLAGMKEMRQKSNNIWEATVLTPGPGGSLDVFGSDHYGCDYRCLFIFQIR